MSNPRIQVILGSTREGRFGPTVANWFMSIADERTDMEAELIDLRDWPLPFFDSPKSPASGAIAPEAHAWSKKIASADGYVIVTPEYNRGYTGVLKNALDHLWYEWNNKPLGLVGYGGAGGGARAIQQLRQVATELQMVPIRTEVVLVSARRLFSDEGHLKESHHVNTANQLLSQLIAYAKALQPLRSKG